MKLTWLRELGWMGSWLVGELTADISGIFLKPGSERNPLQSTLTKLHLNCFMSQVYG